MNQEIISYSRRKIWGRLLSPVVFYFSILYLICQVTQIDELGFYTVSIYFGIAMFVSLTCLAMNQLESFSSRDESYKFSVPFYSQPFGLWVCYVSSNYPSSKWIGLLLILLGIYSFLLIGLIRSQKSQRLLISVSEINALTFVSALIAIWLLLFGFIQFAVGDWIWSFYF